MKHFPRVLFRVLGALCLAGAPCGTALAQSPTPGPSNPIAVHQDDLDEDRKLPRRIVERAARVLARNQALLGAHPTEFCGRRPAAQRSQCRAEVDAIGAAEIGNAPSIFENSPLDQGGTQWPNRANVSQFRRLRLSVPLRKGDHTTSREISMVWFRSEQGDETEDCLFPLEHWSWSEMDRPERFAQAPVGICANRELTVTQHLVEQAPEAELFAMRFLSEPEARAWAAGDPERIKWESAYTAGHPYAKYFLLNSLRWWRGGTPSNLSSGYGWAIRIEDLDLKRIRELEEDGELFLNIFEDGAQIELTNRTRAGLVALLKEKHQVFVDASELSATEPRLEPLED